jgi:nucleotide-binding universal stress UspA family protein
MSYKSLMVHLELNGDNEGVLAVAGELASRFGARVIGMATCQPVKVLYGEDFSIDEVVAQDRAEIAKELASTEKQFRAALKGRAHDVQWRSAITYGPLADVIAEEARAADLIVTGIELKGQLFDDTRRVAIGDLMMRAGRPLLLVPKGVRSLPMRHVFVGWKESRESRRAVADAVPLLREAQRATVLEAVSAAELSQARDRVEDVAGWLAAHGVEAKPEALGITGGELGFLRDTLLDRKCDLFVAGGYGHARISEWVFGGVTYDLLLHPDCCVLLSH